MPVPSWQALVSRIFYYHRQNMFGIFFGPFSILITKAFSATVLQPSQSSIAQSDASAVQSQPLILANASSNGTASANNLEITCDSEFGRNLRVTSCKNIFPLLREGTEQYVFADRTSTQHYDIGLPFRVQGRKLHDSQTRCEVLSDREL